MITPWTVEGEVDYEKIMREFGAEPLTDDLIEKFPKPIHPLIKRKLFYAHRDIEKFLESEKASVVTGRGPSGPMHIGHIIPFYFAKYLQEKKDCFVILPLSNDEKYLVRDKNMKEIWNYTVDNLKDILAVDFDPKKTRIIVDTLDGDVLYPLAVLFSKKVTFSTVRAVFGEEFRNIGWIFYPAVQITHILLPQIILGKHITIVPCGIDQDPFIRLCRDIAEKFRLEKPGALLSKFFPSLEDPTGKMSTSDPDKVIWLTDDYKTIRRKLFKHAFSGGQPTIELHRKLGGNPWIDVSFLYLYYFFEPDDEKIEEIREKYQKGEMLTGELKEYAAKKIWEFLKEHQERRKEVDPLEDLEKFRLKDKEREKIIDFVHNCEL